MVLTTASSRATLLVYSVIHTVFNAIHRRMRRTVATSD